MRSKRFSVKISYMSTCRSGPAKCKGTNYGFKKNKKTTLPQKQGANMIGSLV